MKEPERITLKLLLQAINTLTINPPSSCSPCEISPRPKPLIYRLLINRRYISGFGLGEISHGLQDDGGLIVNVFIACNRSLSVILSGSFIAAERRYEMIF